MNTTVQGIITVTGRVLLSAIFLMSALANKIPNFGGVTEYMRSHHVPAPAFMLIGAIAFLIIGSASVILGYQARVGATLLLIFLVLATYYFHRFWEIKDATSMEAMNQQAHFMKNVGLAGAMLFIIGHGSGPMSLDARKSA